MPSARYDILKMIGEGGMAVAHLARMEAAGGVSRLCVVKTIREELAGRAEFRAAFFDEARVAMALTHGSLVHTYDFGERDGRLFLAMEWCDAGDLEGLMHALARRGERLPLELAVLIGVRLLDGLQAAHEATDSHGRALNLVHRDISPGNILLTFAGEVKLADFGIARAADRVVTTQAGRVKGKPAYLSPEQARGETAGVASDVFAAGTVLWEIIAGRRLFDGGATKEVIERVRAARVPRPDQYRDGLPPRLSAVILRALAADPADRFPNARVFRAELMGFAAQEGLTLDAAELSAFLHERLPDTLEDARRVRVRTPALPEDDSITRFAETEDGAAGAITTPVEPAPEPRGGLRARDIAIVATLAALSIAIAFALSGGKLLTRRPPLVEPIAALPQVTPTAATTVLEASDRGAGALVTVDGAPIGFAPLRASVNAAKGKRAVRFALPGRRAESANMILKPNTERDAPAFRPTSGLTEWVVETETTLAGRRYAPGESVFLIPGLYRVETGEGVRYVRVGDDGAVADMPE